MHNPTSETMEENCPQSINQRERKAQLLPCQCKGIVCCCVECNCDLCKNCDCFYCLYEMLFDDQSCFYLEDIAKMKPTMKMSRDHDKTITKRIRYLKVRCFNSSFANFVPRQIVIPYRASLMGTTMLLIQQQRQKRNLLLKKVGRALLTIFRSRYT